MSVLHKMESAATYDKIAVLDGGVLMDFGEAADVMARCQLFASLGKSN